MNVTVVRDEQLPEHLHLTKDKKINKKGYKGKIEAAGVRDGGKNRYKDIRRRIHDCEEK